MEKLSNTKAELKKSVAYEKNALIFTILYVGHKIVKSPFILMLEVKNFEKFSKYRFSVRHNFMFCSRTYRKLRNHFINKSENQHAES